MASQVSISFRTPDDKFPPNGVSPPVINLFLFEAYENAELRTMEPLIERRSDGTATRVPPPVHIDCHYLVTVFTQDQLGSEMDEHTILGATLAILLKHRVIPAAVLKGVLAGKTPPVRALAARRGTSGSELWQALNRRPKVCFHYTLTVPLDVLAVESPTTPVTVLTVGGP